MKRFLKRFALIALLASVAGPAYAQHKEVVEAVKSELQAQGRDLSGACGAFAITKRVAWQLRAEGVGLLDKPAGNNCDSYSVDYLVYRDGRGADILGDAGNGNVPGWNESVDVTLIPRWRAPVDPGDIIVIPPPVIISPLPSIDLSGMLAQLTRVETKLDALAASEDAFHEQARHAWRSAGIFLAKYGSPIIAGIIAGKKL